MGAGGGGEWGGGGGLMGGGGEAESGEFHEDVRGELLWGGEAVEGDGEIGFDGPMAGGDFDGEAAAGELGEGVRGGFGECDGDDEGVGGEMEEFGGREAGNDPAYIGMAFGEGQGIGEGAFVGHIDRAGELIAGENFRVPIRALVGRGEGMLRIDSKHNERNLRWGASNYRTPGVARLL